MDNKSTYKQYKETERLIAKGESPAAFEARIKMLGINKEALAKTKCLGNKQK